MCWSWPISLTFSLFQWICIAYMLYRNAMIDRWMSLYQSIIATQEFAQFLLWAFVFGAGNRIETVDQCSILNQALSYILLIVVEAMPWILCLIFIRASVPSLMTVTDGKGRVRRYMLIGGMSLSMLEYVVQIAATIYYHSAGVSAMCSYVGEGGYMAWGYMVGEGRHSIFGIATMPMYLLPIALSLLFRPLWIIAPIAVYGFVSAAFLNVYFNRSGEWAPMWCWANFASTLWFLAVPRIARRVDKSLEDSGSKWKWLFYGTQEYINKRSDCEMEMTVNIGDRKGT